MKETQPTERTPEEIAAYKARREAVWAEKQTRFVGSGYFVLDGNWHSSTEISAIEFSRTTSTEKEAFDIAASYPKWVGVRSTRLYNQDNTVGGHVSFRVQLRKDGVNGGVNETGIKRLKAFCKLTPDFGWDSDCVTNAVPEDVFRAFLNA